MTMKGIIVEHFFINLAVDIGSPNRNTKPKDGNAVREDEQNNNNNPNHHASDSVCNTCIIPLHLYIYIYVFVCVLFIHRKYKIAYMTLHSSSLAHHVLCLLPPPLQRILAQGFLFLLPISLHPSLSLFLSFSLLVMHERLWGVQRSFQDTNRLHPLLRATRVKRNQKFVPRDRHVVAQAETAQIKH